MNIMTRRGQLDNVVTYEHICDNTADLANISSSYITLGSIAIVLQGNAGLEVYMANTQKQWISLLTSGGSSGGAGIDGTTFTPAVSSAGIISWTNDGNKTNPTSVDLVAAVIAALPSATGVNF